MNIDAIDVHWYATTSVETVLGAVLVEIRTLYVIIEMKDNARCIKKLYFYGGSYMNIAAH